MLFQKCYMNRIIRYIRSWNWLCSLSSFLEIHPICCVYQKFILLYCCVMLPYYWSKVNSHYLWISYLKISLLTKIFCNPKIHSTFTVIHWLWRVTNIWATWCARSQMRSNKAMLCFLISALILQTIVLFMVFLVLLFFHNFVFFVAEFTG